MSSGQIMTIIIVSIVMVTSLVSRIIKVRYQYAHKIGPGVDEQARASAGEADRLRGRIDREPS